ncbi:MSMEG_0570 family nitrogen starvation response protein [Spongiibacter taiwanensis]|uniref:MSMEG_0570 family nitrogen starvation response protein n=1 Tax=Spongiibacter taiwanensis TaxID=1748242 RepID=UPI00203640C6|nr:MSMEG_0570 family nitrogen starvation response protein [Spongiibacter taiwanensis]USA42780.1 MSMEG_0570 family nitrogen starvation response protein [Spongiibacter taiwanensis]
MPAVNFTLIWPDGERRQYYSPSTVIYQHLESGAQYSQQEFARRVRTALTQASERVRDKFGYACSAAGSELASLESKLSQLQQHNITGDIQVVDLRQ